MTTLRKSKLLIILAAVCVLSIAYGEQTERPKRQLKFEVATGKIGFPGRYSDVTHVGNFHVTKDRRLKSWVLEISKTSQWNQMSEKQRQFISKLENEYRAGGSRNLYIGDPFSAKSDYVRTPEGTATYRVHGVSTDDVRKMAEAVIEWLDNQAHELLETQKEKLEYNRKVIIDAEKILPKLEAECKRLEAQAEEKTKEYAKTNYEIDRTKRKEVLEHARKNMEELARYMKLANFELIGLQARIGSIERFKAGGKISDPGTLVKLDQMLIADEIERAGVMARKNAYEEAFKQTKELYDVIMSSNDAAAQKLDWEMKLTDAQRDKNDAERVLANPPKQMQPVEVYENKVVIWQVKQN